MGSGGHSPYQMGSLPGHRKTSLELAKLLILGSKSGRSVPTQFSDQSGPQLRSEDEHTHLLGLPRGHCRYEIRLPRFMCWFCKPLPSFLLQSNSMAGPCIFPYNPVGQDQSRGSLKVTCNTRGASCPTRFSFPTGRTRSLEENLLFGAVLAWRRDNTVNVCPLLSSFQCRLSWSLWCKGPASASPPCSKILSQRCLVLE